MTSYDAILNAIGRFDRDLSTTIPGILRLGRVNDEHLNLFRPASGGTGLPQDFTSHLSLTQSNSVPDTTIGNVIQSLSAAAPSPQATTTPTPQPAPAPAANRHETTVREAYRKHLGREPEPAGLQSWIRHLEQGKSVRWLNRQIARSPEARTRKRTPATPPAPVSAPVPTPATPPALAAATAPTPPTPAVPTPATSGDLQANVATTSRATRLGLANFATLDAQTSQALQDLQAADANAYQQARSGGLLDIQDFLQTVEKDKLTLDSLVHRAGF